MTFPRLAQGPLAALIALLGSHAVAAPVNDAPDAVGRLLSSTASSSRSMPAPPQASTAVSASDIDSVKTAIHLGRRGKAAAAMEHQGQIHDATARKLVEWVLLRADDTTMSFVRYATFTNANPSWPGATMFRRRAEARLWIEHSDPGTVLAFFSGQPPLSAHGQLAMARALLMRGDRVAAQGHLRAAWREGQFSAERERQVLHTFGSLLTRADHKTRMDFALYANDPGRAMRAAQRLGAAEVAIVKAYAAVHGKSGNAGALLSAVPRDARNDPAYLFTHIQWLRRNDHISEATRLMLSAPHDAGVILDPDAWWIERRLLVRKLLDGGHARQAYRVASGGPLPSKETLRVDQPFTAGWIALRFLGDSHTAARHFARVPQLTTHPTSLARAHYWLGRTAEAAGQSGEARRHYEAAAHHSAAYYGQLANARLGRRKIALRQPPAISQAQRAALRSADLIRAVDLLYRTGNRDLVVPFVADLGRISDVRVLTLIAEIAAGHADARAMLTIGKTALARGIALDQYAFPRIGLPKYAAIGPKADTSLVYAIARAESAFNAGVVSSANARGLMQVTPDAGRTIARRLGISFDAARLLNDPVYNVQLGSAEIADLVKTYDGNHVLAFVGYNAGRGRVREWIARFGDPRNPDVDVVDWVERIPFQETRTYVQRVMENLQVYRALFDRPRSNAPGSLTIESDMRGEQG